MTTPRRPPLPITDEPHDPMIMITRVGRCLWDVAVFLQTSAVGSTPFGRHQSRRLVGTYRRAEHVGRRIGRRMARDDRWRRNPTVIGRNDPEPKVGP